MSKWHKAFSTDQLHRAEIVKDVLTDQNIPAVVVPFKSTSHLLGHYEVHVSEENILKALKIINNDIIFE